MLSLTFEEFQAKAAQGNLIPLTKTIPADIDTPVSAFLKIQTGKHDFLLESVVGGEKWGRYSFLGTEPRAIFKSRGSKVEILKGHHKESHSFSKDPLETLEEYLHQFKPVPDENLPRFFGGVVGYLAYDMVRHFETIPQTAQDELNLYDAYFLVTDTVVIFDNARQVMQVVANIHVSKEGSLKSHYEEGVHKIEKLVSKLRGPCPSPTAKEIKKTGEAVQATLKPLYSEEEYCALVEKAKEYVKAGDIFQVQISNRFEAEVDINPFSLYRAIRRINPSPYLYFLQLEDMAMVGASPEVMVRLEHDKVELRPIAGTRKRGKTPEEDEAMEIELKNDPKERAEHVMLVDLGRNDLGRVCEAGSVKVDEQEVLERYSHVMHLVSHVSGRLKKGLNAFHVLRATFPAGTLTGAPKIRAMEIIEELEGKRRGIYGGAVGYIGFDGNMDMAITIRTALLTKKKMYVQAAGGIVYDSIPKLEFKESCNKARGMIAALESLT